MANDGAVIFDIIKDIKIREKNVFFASIFY